MHVFGGFVSCTCWKEKTCRRFDPRCVYQQGISFYGGTALRGYQTTYYLLGGLAILVGLVILLWFPDSPMTWRMLAEEQRIACLEHVRDDQRKIK